MKKFQLMRLIVVLLGVIVAGCGGGNNDENLRRFIATLSGDQEVPPVNTTATGTVAITVDEDQDEINFTLNVSNISNVTLAHIHSGAPTVNGDIRAFLFAGPQTGTVNGQLATGTVTTADLTGITFDQLLTEMAAGNAYVNVHTVQNPDGEIRGQIIEID
jgi:hypothetical protein